MIREPSTENQVFNQLLQTSIFGGKKFVMGIENITSSNIYNICGHLSQRSY